MMSHPTRAVPAGCVVALFGVFAWVAAALCVAGLVKASRHPDAEVRVPAMKRLAVIGAVNLGVGVVLVGVGWRLAIRSDMSDPHNPDRPMLRF